MNKMTRIRSNQGVAGLLVVGVIGLLALVVTTVFVAQSNTSVEQTQAASEERPFTLSLSEDTYVSSANPNSNFGGSKTLSTGDRSKFTSYLKVNLSSLKGKKVTSAKLKLKVSDTSASEQDIMLVSNSDWRESTMTYRNRPSLGQKVFSFKPTAKDTWLTIDLSQFIPAATSGQVGTVSFAVVSSKVDAFSFYSKESTDKPVFEFTEVVTVIKTPTPAAVPTTQPTRSPNATPTGTPTSTMSPMPGMTMPPVTGSGDNSRAMGLWNPTKWDTCTKAEHDSFFVIGPDGKKYPTWHAPKLTRSNGTVCTFGHEHGRDPKGSPLFAKIQEQFYFDANGNGQLESTERASAGIPFGYVNQQMDVWSAANNVAMMRHEDHVGHKVEWDVNSSVDIDKPDAANRVPTGVKCNVFAKIHQGTHSPDAFGNNLHESIVLTDCNSGGYDIRLAIMAKFGKPGQFGKSLPCDPRGEVVNVGLTDMNRLYPAGSGGRNIAHWDCVKDKFLVPAGKFSGNFYEDWNASLNVTMKSGKVLNGSPSGGFTVFDPVRYFRPGATHNGVVDNLGYIMDLCYEVEPNGDAARGTCHVTDFGRIKDITFDDPRSMFKDAKREVYFQANPLSNAGGPTVIYTDPFGSNGQTTPFPGSIKQFVAAVDINYGKQFGGAQEPNAFGADRDYDDGSVHAPN